MLGLIVCSIIAVAGFLFAAVPCYMYSYWVNKMPTVLFPHLELLDLTPEQQKERKLCIEKVQLWDKRADWWYIGWIVYVLFTILAIIFGVC